MLVGEMNYQRGRVKDDEMCGPKREAGGKPQTHLTALSRALLLQLPPPS